MGNPESIKFDTKGFSCKVENGLAVLNIKGNAFRGISSINRNNDIIPWLDEVDNYSEVRGLLILNEKESMSEKAYVDFLKEIAGDNFNAENPKNTPKFIKEDIRAREITILGNIINALLGFNKIIISGIRGNIVSPFFGLNLIADFRFTEANTNFILSHIKYRLHPSGGLPYFLPLYLSHSKVIELLFRGGSIPAEELKDLGLITGFYDESEFIERVRAEAVEICKVSRNVVMSTKKLLYRNKKDFQDYLDLEQKYFIKE
jgi:enoyl-CoA hydratase/carnithine racemase